MTGLIREKKSTVSVTLFLIILKIVREQKITFFMTVPLEQFKRIPFNFTASTFDLSSTSFFQMIEKILKFALGNLLLLNIMLCRKLWKNFASV